MENLPAVWYVLVNPGVGVSTAWVYQNLGLTSVSDGIRLPGFSGAIDELIGLLHNDLESVTAKRYPEVGEAKRRLVAYGAQGVLMSGSGPTVFGVFREEAEARSAAAAIDGEGGWRAFAVRPLADFE